MESKIVLMENSCVLVSNKVLTLNSIFNVEFKSHREDLINDTFYIKSMPNDITEW